MLVGVWGAGGGGGGGKCLGGGGGVVPGRDAGGGGWSPSHQPPQNVDLSTKRPLNNKPEP